MLKYLLKLLMLMMSSLMASAVLLLEMWVLQLHLLSYYHRR